MILEASAGASLHSFHMWATFAIIGITTLMFAWNRVALELTAIATVIAFLVLFHLYPLKDAEGKAILDTAILLKGFANPVLFAIMSLLIIGQGLFQTGAVERPAQFIGGLSRFGPTLAFATTFLVAGAISAFLNNTPVVVIFIPIVSAVAARMGMAAGRVLMPLSFVCILGGMTTLIGSSANLIAAAIAEESGFRKLGFFDFAIPGLLLAGLGALYVIFILPRLITPRATMAENLADKNGKQFIAQITITPDHPWQHKRSAAGLFPGMKNMTVRMVQRGEKTILPPFEDITLKPGDLVIVAATRKVLTDALKDRRSIMTAYHDHTSAETADEGITEDLPSQGEQLCMAETVVAPGSRLIGRSIEQAALRAETDCIVLGLQRRSRMLRTPLNKIKLEAGDVLLVVGTRRAINMLRSHRDLLLLEWSTAELPVTHHAGRALLIFAGTIIAAATGLLPIAIAALTGAALMILTGCLNIYQAARSIDRRIYLLIGTSFAMAEALRLTGGAHYVADSVLSTFAGYGPAVLLSVFFLLTALLTNFLSNHATAALLAPVAVNIAAGFPGIDPAPFVYALIFALNCSFATPLAYQTNLIVMGPGHYQFSDFVKAGLPLILMLWLAYSLFAPFYFDLSIE